MPSFTFHRWQCFQSLHAFKRRKWFHLHFEDYNVFNHCMLSKGDNAFIYILKTTISSITACFQKATMLSVTFRRRQWSKGDNAFIYISKMTMSSIIACFQKVTLLSFTFRRRQCLQSLHAFKRQQCLHLHFQDDNIFNHCMLSKGDNALHLRFWRQQCLLSLCFIGLDVLCVYAFKINK